MIAMRRLYITSAKSWFEKKKKRFILFETASEQNLLKEFKS